MAYQKYQLVYRGTLADNWSQQEVSEALAKLFNCTPEKLAPLFRGKRVIVKKDLTKTQARELRLAMRKAGAVAEFEAMASLAATAAIPRPSPTGAPQPASTTQAQCPKCGHLQPGTVSCSACGVIFAKHRQQQQRQQDLKKAQEQHNLKPTTGSRPVDTDVIPKRFKLPLALLVLLAIGGYFFNEQRLQEIEREQQLAWRTELNLPGIRELTIDQVDNLQQLSARGRYTVVDLFNPSCESCTIFHARQEQLTGYDPSIAIRRLNISDAHIRHQLFHKLNLSGRYALPVTVVLAPDGKVIGIDKPGRPWENQLGKHAFIKLFKQAKRSS